MHLRGHSATAGALLALMLPHQLLHVQNTPDKLLSKRRVVLSQLLLSEQPRMLAGRPGRGCSLLKEGDNSSGGKQAPARRQAAPIHAPATGPAVAAVRTATTNMA